MRNFLVRLRAILTLDRRLRNLQEGLDNQSAAINFRLDQLTDELTRKLAQHCRDLQESFDQQPAAIDFGPEKRSSDLDANKSSDLVADIELIERFSHKWQANASAYRQTLDALRSAALRLLPLSSGVTVNRLALSSGEMQRLAVIEPEVACLAWQPLFYPEMFHAVTLLPDGSFSPLQDPIAEHLRASGLLGPEDRAAVDAIYRRISQNRGAPLRVVEIGSAVGAGSTRIGGKFVKRSGGALYCVDSWPDWMYLAFIANLRVLDLEATVVPIRSPSADAAVLFDDGSLDAVFIDGGHSYPNVLADIDAYLPKIRKNGIMFGHDLHDVPSRFDRRELLDVSTLNHAEVTYTNSDGQSQRQDVHPGVILAVADRFGDDIERFPGSVVWARQV
jgi:predicted O-methyltransferase YrrM